MVKMKKELNIEKHSFVPKHVKLNEQETKELMIKYNVSLKQFSKIYASDPAIKKLEAKPGDVIRVIRPSPTIGKSIFYRVVIDG